MAIFFLTALIQLVYFAAQVAIVTAAVWFLLSARDAKAKRLADKFAGK